MLPLQFSTHKTSTRAPWLPIGYHRGGEWRGYGIHQAENSHHQAANSHHQAAAAGLWRAVGTPCLPILYLSYTILHLCYTYTYAISFLNLYRGYTIPILCLLYYGSTIAILYLYYSYSTYTIATLPILYLYDAYTIP